MNDLSKKNASQYASLFKRIGGETGVGNIVDAFYDCMLSDYRVSRFFNSDDQRHQKDALTQVVAALIDGSPRSEEELKELLDNFFMAAFAREKKSTFFGGSEFSFFSYVIERDNPSTAYLSDAHSHLLQFLPNDQQYDAVLESLSTAMEQLHLEKTLSNEVLAMAENARNSVLGK